MISDIFDLSGKKVIVTGATGGIGGACARAASAFGAELIIAGRNAKKLEFLKKELPYSTSHIIDFENLHQLEFFFAEHSDADVLINSIGINRLKNILQITESDYNDVMFANIKSAFFQTQYFAKAKQIQSLKSETKPSSIIHISSQMGHVGGLERSVYCASKHALEGLCKAAALELGPLNIRINSICPTYIDTPLGRATLNDPTKRDKISNSIVFKRLGRLEDLYGAVVYLASDTSLLVTGTSLRIDGGWTAH